MCFPVSGKKEEKTAPEGSRSAWRHIGNYTVVVMQRCAVLILLILASLVAIGVSYPRKGGTSAGTMRGSTMELGALNIRKAIDVIHERVVLSQIVGEYVSLNPSSGSGSYQCLCPFHNDKNNPSMGISDDKGLYNCLSCDAGGDAIKFVQEIEQLSFQEADLLSANCTTVCLMGCITICRASSEPDLGNSCTINFNLRIPFTNLRVHF